MVVGGDHVHRHTLEGRDDDAALDYRRRQLGPVEVAEARPEPQVRPDRVLRLQAGEPPDRLDGVEVGTLEEQLAREGRAVQVTCGQGQTTILPNLFPARNRS
jgi:hypothetical protein